MNEALVPDCKCGGPATVTISNGSRMVTVQCDDCGHSFNGESLEDAMARWNDWVGEPDTYRRLLAELQGQFCDRWCNGGECGGPDCPMYGIYRRSARLGDSDGANGR